MALFGSRKIQPAPVATNDANVGRSRSMFGRRNRDVSNDSVPRTDSTSSRGSRSMFGNRNKTQSVDLARNKVREAEQAERLAEQHLQAARLSVKDAKNHVDMVEREANEDARQAAVKQHSVKGLKKDTRGLGRL